ncbi:phage tail tape measure protein [Sporolactobacillus sp. STSJ-5]|uniref:phage tail tape measure protein n=1 Tax=Sporolactobacillus sp. STSJ-5 TaxID=2965076 RepID=UPI002104856F|nr:phage tail tape measure protein [Sporolactobacillus sp. STSJ-5]MCQ2009264.1 phage tail tape measure protein [Sporolactobacillus sp. STSJ-5]
MASRIKGITIEIDGNTTGLEKALQSVNSQARSMQGQLNDVNRLLKFNPGNVTLLAQKQKLLASQVENTKDKLNQLKQAESQVQKQFAEGKISEKQYQAFQREIVATEGKLEHFKGQLAEASAALKANGSVAHQVAKDYQESFDDAKKSMNNTFDGLKTAGKTVTAAGAGIAAGLGFAVKSAADFDQAMANAYAVMAPDEVNKFKGALKDLAVQMGAETKYSGKEAAEGIGELLKAGVSVTDVIHGGLKGALSLATAGDLSLADSAQIASTALNAFKNDNLSVSKAADILAGAANASATDVSELQYGLSMVSAVASGVGWSFKDTTTALAEFAQNGLRGSDAGTSLKTMLLNLQPATDKAAGKMKDLGIITKDGNNLFIDSKGNFKGLAEVSQILQDHLGGLTKAQQQAALKTMFGTDAVRAANIMMNEGAKGATNMATAMGKVSADDVAAQKMNTLKGAIELLKGSLETAAQTIGDALLPALRVLVGAVQGLVDKFNSLPKGMQSFIAIGAAVAAALALIIGPILLLIGFLPAIAAGFAMLAGPVGAVIGIVALVVAAIIGLVAIIKNLWQTNEQFRDNVMTIWKGIQAIFQAVMPAITAIVKVAWFLIKSIIVSVLDAVKNVISGAVGVIANIFKLFGSLLTGNWKGAWDAIKGLLQSAVQLIWGIVNLYFVGKLLAPLRAFGPAAKSILQAIWGAIKGIFTGGVGAIRGFVEGGFNLIRSVISNVMNGVRSVISTVWNFIRGNISGAVSSARSAVSGAFNAIRSVVSSVMGGIKGAVSRGWNAAVSFLKGINLASIGKNIIRGLINGIGSMMGAITDKIKSIAGNITGGIKKALGIHSPSRVMRDEVGKMVGAGLQVGMLDSLKGIGQAADQMANASIPNVPDVASVNSTTSGGTGGSSAVFGSSSDGIAKLLSAQLDMAQQQIDLLMKLLLKSNDVVIDQDALESVISRRQAQRYNAAAYMGG